MSAAFDYAYAFTMSRPIENGAEYTDTPGDPGGPTKYGVDLATLSVWRKRACTAADVQQLGEAEAEAIAGAMYWNPVRGDSLAGGVGLMVFDEAYNTGVGNSARILQALVGASVDGSIGPETITALERFVADPTKLSPAAAECLQRFLGVGVDGDVGPETLKALRVAAGGSAAVVCCLLYDSHLAHYAALDDPEFTRGWDNRAKLRTQSALAYIKQAAI